jgi:hypothetical protein
MEKVNLAETCARFHDHWSPKIVRALEKAFWLEIVVMGSPFSDVIEMHGEPRSVQQTVLTHILARLTPPPPKPKCATFSLC